MQGIRFYSRGAVAIMFLLMLIVLIGIVGLAIDTGRAYGVRAKLSHALDAASLAAGRALATGASDADRSSAAITAGTRYYNANYPVGYMGSTLGPVSLTAVHNASGYWTVVATGSATVPITFLGALGVAGPTLVSASATSVRRDIDVMLVLDSSGSLAIPASTLPNLKTAAINNFVQHFAAGVGGDRVGVLTFASGALVSVPIDKTVSRGFNLANVTSAINAVQAAGSTAQAEGLRGALGELDAIPVNLRSSLRVIAFFSDGAPNDVSAAFVRVPSNATVTGDLYSETGGPATAQATRLYSNTALNTQTGTYSDIATLPTLGIGGIPLAGYNGLRTLSGNPVTNTQCNVNKAARNMAENVANIARSEGVIVMTVGLGAALTTNELTYCGYGASEYGANILNRFSNSSVSDTYNSSQPQGMYCYAADSTQLSTCFNLIADAVLRLTQ